MLKMTGTKLELFSDIYTYLFIENGMSGGISYIAKRHSKANNKYSVMIVVKKVNTLLILMQIIYMVGQCVSIYHIMDLNG